MATVEIGDLPTARGTALGRAPRGTLLEAVPQPIDRRSAFVAAWPTLRPLLASISASGVVAVAVHRSAGEAVAAVSIVASPREPRGVVIGKCSACSLLLSAGPEIASRQAALIVAPIPERSPVPPVIALHDLAPKIGLRDASAIPARTLRARGVLFASIAAYDLVCVASGAVAPRLERAEDAWSALGWRQGDDTGAIDATRILGWLRIVSTQGETTGPVDGAMLDTGLLLGRDAHCTGSAFLVSPEVSRVHVLLVRGGGRVWAIDLGSSNGFDVLGPGGLKIDQRIAELDDDTEVQLARGAAIVAWKSGAQSRPRPRWSRAGTP